MKEHPVIMHTRALPVHPLPLQRKHAAALVAAVLLLHLWVLSRSALWLSPEADAPSRAQALITRQIEAPTPRAPQKPAPAAQPRARIPQATPAPDSDHAADVPPPPPLQFDDLGNDLTAPVGLPARTASSVDLPPYKRPPPLGAEGLTDVSDFKAPDSARLKYKVQGRVKGFDYWASADLLWTQDGTNYEARLEVGAFLLGSRTQTSKGVLGSEGLMPTRFGDKTRNELAAHFQRDKGVISFSANTPEVPLFKGAQDRLSVVLQLSSLLAADPERFPLGTMLTFQTVSQREAEIWQFGVEKEELLPLPYGDINAIKLHRKPRREFDQNIELWFAPSLGYLPVRMRITNANGDQVDQVLNKVEKPGS
jgi:hypothetical protein